MSKSIIKEVLFHPDTEFQIENYNQYISKIYLPILDSDGEKIAVYVRNFPEDKDQFRIFDFGHTLSRFQAKNYELNSPRRKYIFHRIMSESDVQDDDGVLYMMSYFKLLYRNILQFAVCTQKISTMNLFY